MLDEAAALLRAGGVDALSMRRLADALGVSYQVVYSRVGGKADVVRALHDRWFAELAAHPLPAVADPVERIVAVGLHYLRTAVEDPVRFEVMFGSPVPEFVRDDAAQAVEYACFRATWVAACAAWCEVHLDPRPKGAAMRLAWRQWTAVHGITAVHLAGHHSPSGDPETEVREVVALLCEAARL